ncbi:LuxR family transcriptional regulator [Actinoplanes missouriensis]|uniref:LuxR family transcriptional regulator n=1 Tax=Actinoplanes missouriensis TaxID=1866 RepID=UPI0033DC308A
MRLFGRERELATMLGFLDDVRTGRGGVLALCGQAGVGKSRLLQEITDRYGAGLRLVTVTGVEFEAALPYSGLQRLCEPLFGEIDGLSAAHAQALRRAFGQADANPAEADDSGLLLAVSVLALLSQAAAKAPVMWVVDDVAWIDEASRAVLTFLSRRIAAVPAGLVVIARDDEVLSPFGGVLLTVDGLPDAPARDLLMAAVARPLDPQVRDRIVAEARGNPLALLELPHSIAVTELAGGYSCPAEQSLPETVEAEFRRRLDELPVASSQLVMLSAADPTGDPALLWQAAVRLGIPAVAGTAAEATGLITFGTRVLFRHPLARSAAYHRDTAETRRAAHRALAAVTDPVRDPDRRAWHLALAATGPDELVAAELSRGASRARARGGAGAGAAFLEQAAYLTPDPRRRTSRLLEAAAAKRAAGAPTDAAALLAEAALGPRESRQVALTQALHARLAFDLRRDPDAMMMLLTAAEQAAPVDPVLARELLREAYAAAVFVGRYGTPDAISRIAAATVGLPPLVDSTPRELLFEGLLMEKLDGPAAATSLLRRGIHGYTDEPASQYTLGDLWLACGAALDCWDETAFLDIAQSQVRAIRDSGAIVSLPVALSYRSLIAVHEGKLDDAQQLVDEAARISDELGLPPMAYVDITIAAWRGDEARVERIAAAAEPDARSRKEGRLLTAIEYARALLLNGLGRHADAMTASAPAAMLDEMGFRPTVPPEFIEAAARSGRTDLAVPALRRLSRAVEGAPDRNWAMGMLTRCEALVTDDPDLADRRFRESVERFTATTLATEEARSRLLYGEWLQRAGRDEPARNMLRAAAERFTEIGAGAFANRAQRALAASGERPRHRNTRTGAPLTAQEQQVARVVAGGATTKEAANQLFLSPRTVDAHLRSIFAKLGVTSRRQLAERLAQAPSAD